VSLPLTILTGIVRDAAQTGAKAVLLEESLAQVEFSRQLGFFPVKGGMLKIVLSGWLTNRQVSELLTWNDPEVERIRAALPRATTESRIASQLEHVLWPGKLAEACLRSYIVPIRPHYAEQLFESRLAGESFLGADLDLALNPESAYYRSARFASMRFPSRVLWYVSDNDIYQDVKSIRACSRVTEIMIGTPKLLFRRFGRLGVYKWRKVVETAGGLNRKLMAFRFDDTELLRPVPWNEVQRT
jgi:hypothetical protein